MNRKPETFWWTGVVNKGDSKNKQVFFIRVTGMMVTLPIKIEIVRGGGGDR